MSDVSPGWPAGGGVYVPNVWSLRARADSRPEASKNRPQPHMISFALFVLHLLSHAPYPPGCY